MSGGHEPLRAHARSGALWGLQMAGSALLGTALGWLARKLGD